MKKIIKLFTILMVFIFVSTGSYADSFDILDEFIDMYTAKNSVSENINSKNKSGEKEKKEEIQKATNDVITNARVVLGDEMLFTDEYKKLIDGKKIGVVTNQTGVNSKGENIKDVLYNYKGAKLVALYAPEHGIDGTIKAGSYVSTYVDKKTGLPVYSLYGQTREPTKKMLENVDVLLFDLQDIGSRTYTYISTMYKCLEACKKYGKTFVVLDRPNPVSGKYVEGFMLVDEAKSFVGIDNMPMAHGMTVAELAKYFNRNIGANLKIVPMKNYKRNMIWQDTGLKFKQTSPYIPNIESAFGYMATGQSENMGIGMRDSFTWSGGPGINSKELAKRLNALGLGGVNFVAQQKGSSGGVRVNVTNYHIFNPAKTGYYIMATANQLKPLKVSFYERNKKPSMFYKISGNKKFGEAILAKKSAQEIEQLYRQEAEKFKQDTKKYYIYD